MLPWRFALRPSPETPRPLIAPGGFPGDRSVLGSGWTLENESVANIRRTTVSLAAACCSRGARGQIRRQAGLGQTLEPCWLAEATRLCQPGDAGRSASGASLTQPARRAAVWPVPA